MILLKTKPTKFRYDYTENTQKPNEPRKFRYDYIENTQKPNEANEILLCME